MSLRQIKQKLELMSEQEIIDAGYCPECFKNKGAAYKLMYTEGCKRCFHCGFSLCG